MYQPVEIEFRHAVGRLFEPAQPLVLAVSGGGDSVALLHLVRGLAPADRPSITVAHLDHALRDDSESDRRFVEQLAADLGLPRVVERRPVERRRDESLEEAARRVRRGFLLDQAKRLDATIVTGHTLDDQAETILMRWARGASATALGGMDERGPGPVVRPLLRIERAALRDWLRAGGHVWREDPHNEDPRFERTRARQLLPRLADQLNPRVASHLCDAARRVRADAHYLDDQAAERLRAISSAPRDGLLELDAAALAAEPTVLAGRMVALALRRGGVDPRRVLSRHVEALLDLARGGTGRRIDLPGRRVAERAAERIRIIEPVW